MTKRRYGRGAVALVGGAVALAAMVSCNQHPLEELEETVTAVNRQENRLPAKTKIDFLFVVDNSGSMCEEQDNLTRNFQAFSDFLFEELGASADYRIAVTSTDMNPDNGERGRFLAKPAFPVESLNCQDEETGEPKVPNTADCQELVDNGELDPIIKSGVEGNIGTNCNAADPEAQAACAKADLERKFRCLATLGTQGDGFEKGLEALRVSLSCDGPNGPTYQNGQLVSPGKFGPCCVPVEERGRTVLRYNAACEIGENDAEPEFLRPDAVLVVIIVSDEDDCSDPATNPAASRRAICKYATTDTDNNGIPDGFNDPELCGNRAPADCYRAECGNLQPDECRQRRCEIPRTENNSCEWFRSDLTPVQDYYRFLTGLKARPLEQLVVATIVGQRDYTTPSAFEITYNSGQTPADCVEMGPDGERIAITTDQCCPNGGRCVGEIATSCESDNGEAFAGRRYLNLAETFGENGIGCPPPPAGLPDDAQRVVACRGAQRDADCEFLNELNETILGQCRPVEGEGTLVCTECVTICEDNFAKPLEAIKEKVAQIVATYCLDKPPACQVSTEEGTRACQTPEEFDDPANYPIRVRKQCLLTEDQGGLCQELVPPTVLPRNEWTLRLNQAGCDGGALVQLDEPPPAGAEIFVEFLVEVGAEAGGAVDGGAPPPQGDAAPMEMPAN